MGLTVDHLGMTPVLNGAQGATAGCMPGLRDFTVVPANTPRLLDEVYRLRYSVYCIEHDFLDATQFPNGREVDDYDAYSHHAIVLHKRTLATVATVRLVVPPSGQELPMEKALRSADRLALRELGGRLAEVSRYAVSKDFRRRRGEDEYADVDFGRSLCAPERRSGPQFTVALMRAIFGFCVEQRVDLLCAVMAPALARMLARIGLTFEPLGSSIEFHGQRQPCFAQVETLLLGLGKNKTGFLDIISTGFDPLLTSDSPPAMALESWTKPRF